MQMGDAFMRCTTLHRMRKTITLDDKALATAHDLTHRDDLRAVAAAVSGRSVPTSESGCISLLAAIGAETITRRAMEQGYEALAEALAGDPAPRRTQRAKGRPIAGEGDEQLEGFYRALEP